MVEEETVNFSRYHPKSLLAVAKGKCARIEGIRRSEWRHSGILERKPFREFWRFVFRCVLGYDVMTNAHLVPSQLRKYCKSFVSRLCI